MERCRIKALAEGYSANVPLRALSSSGEVLNNVGTIGSKSAIVNVTWKVNSCNFNYMMMFYILYKNLAFNIDLIYTEGSVETKICKFVPDTFKSINENFSWTITAQLEIIK